MPSPETTAVLPVKKESAHAIPANEHRPLLPQRRVPLRGVHHRRVVHPGPHILHHQTVSPLGLD